MPFMGRESAGVSHDEFERQVTVTMPDPFSLKQVERGERRLLSLLDWLSVHRANDGSRTHDLPITN